MERDLLYWLLAILLVATGLAGVVLPAIPGAPLIFAGLFVAAWVENFVYVGKWTLTILGLLALLTYGVDFWATMFGAKRFGASKRAIVGALAGTIVGLFLGLPGVLFGPFIGAVIGELSARRQPRRCGTRRIRRDYRLGAGCRAQADACFINDRHIRGGTVFLSN